MRVTSWSCGLASGLDRSATVPTCPDTRGSFLRLHIRFPECWNGRQLDSADHKSHMAYATRAGCPSTHPVEVPQITQIYRYPTRGGEGFSLASGGQYSAHADFVNAWKPGALRKLVDDCLNALVHCGRAQLGRGSPREGGAAALPTFTEPSQAAATVSRRATLPPLVRDPSPAPRGARASPARRARARPRGRRAEPPVPSLEPDEDRRALEPPRLDPCPPGRSGGRVQASPRGVLRRIRLAPSGDEARGGGLPVCRVLRLGPAARRRQDDLPARPGVAHPRARRQLPRHGGDPLRDVDALGAEHRQLVARGGCDGPRADGRGRVRRRSRRHLGAERAHLGSSPRRRQRPDEHPRVPARPLRRRRQPPHPRCRPRDRLRAAHGRRLRLPEHAPGLARRHGLLDGHGDVRERLVAGGLRRPAQLRRPRLRRLGRAASTSTTISSTSSCSPAQGLRRSSRRVHTSGRRTARSRTERGRERPRGAGRWCPSSRWRRTSPPRSTRCASSASRRVRHATTGGSHGRHATRPACRTPTSPRRRGRSSTGWRPRFATRASRIPKTRRRRVRRGSDAVCGGSPGGVAQRGVAIVPGVGAVDPLDRARGADQGRRRRRVGARSSCPWRPRSRDRSP